MSSALDQMKKTLESNKVSEKKPQPPVKQTVKKQPVPVKKPIVKNTTPSVQKTASVFNKTPGVKTTVVNKNVKSTHDRFTEAAEKAIERELHEPGVSTTPPWEDLPQKTSVIQEKKPEVKQPVKKLYDPKPISTPAKHPTPSYSAGLLGVPGSGFHSVSTTVKR